MYTSPLSPVTKASLTSVGTDSVTFMQSNNIGLLQIWLVEKAAQMLSDGAPLWVVVKDRQDAAAAMDALSQYRLGHMALVSQVLDEEFNLAIEQIPYLLKLKKVNITACHELKTRQTIELNQEITEKIAPLYQPFYHQYKLKNIIELGENIGKVQVPDEVLTELNQYPLTKEFYSVLDSIIQHYQAHHALLPQDMVKEKVYQSKDTIRRAKDQIGKLLEQTNQIYHEFTSVKHQLLAHKKEEVDHEIKNLKLAHEQLREAYYDYTNQDNAYASQVGKILAPLRQHTHLKLEWNVVKVAQWSYTPKLIQLIKSMLEDAEFVKLKVATTLYKRLTPFNVDNEALQTVISQLSELQQNIQTLGVLDIEVNYHAMTLSGLENEISKTRQHLKHIYDILQDDSYNTYRLLQNQYCLSNDTLQWLKANYSEYLIIDIHRQLKAKQITDNQWYKGLVSRYEKSEAIQAQIQQGYRDALHNKWVETRQKRKDEDFVSLLKEWRKSSFKSILTDHCDLIQTFFPIIIIHQDEMSLHASLPAQATVFWNTTALDINTVLSAYRRHPDISIVSTHAIDIQELQKHIKTSLYFNFECPLPQIRPFNTLNRSARYTQALSLAANMYSVIPQFSVYRIRHLCIISLLSPHMNTRLQKATSFFEWNTLYEESNEIGDLIDAMVLMNTDVMLCHENGLLNEQNLHTLDWQLHVLGQLRAAEVQLVNMCSHDMMKDLDHAIEKAAEQIITVCATRQDHAEKESNTTHNTAKHEPSQPIAIPQASEDQD